MIQMSDIKSDSITQ